MATKRALDEGETGQAKRQVVDEAVLFITVASIDHPFCLVVRNKEDWFPEYFAKVIEMLDEDDSWSCINVRDTMRNSDVQQMYTYLAVLSYGDEWLDDDLGDDSDDDSDDFYSLPRDARRKRIQDLLDAGKYSSIDFAIPVFRGVHAYKTTGPCYHVVLHIGK
jgi:hypothetical protein